MIIFIIQIILLIFLVILLTLLYIGLCTDWYYLSIKEKVFSVILLACITTVETFIVIEHYKLLIG